MKSDDVTPNEENTLPTIPSRFERLAMARPGRPSKLTEDTVDNLLKAIREGQTYAVACSYAGICYQTLRNWIKTASNDVEQGELTEYVAFLDMLSRAEAQAERKAVRAWSSHFKSDYRAARDFLAARNPDQWARRDRMDINAKVSVGVVMLPPLDVPETRKPLSDKALDVDYEVVDDNEKA
jgi:transposase-like protein